MSSVLLCNRDLTSPAIQQACNINLQQLSAPHCPSPAFAKANTPYLLNGHSSAQGRRIQTLLSPPQVARPVTELSLTFGEDNTVAIAAMMEQLKDYNIALTGASTSVYGERISGFAKSVKEYQVALLTYRDAKLGNASNHRQLKQQAHRTFQRMQAQFRAELHATTNHISARRGIPLTNPERGINIARSSRNAAKLHFANEIEAHKLVRFSQYTKLLGNGLAVIDFGTRVGNVRNSYRTGGHWERDLFIESSSFTASAITGIATAKAGAAALGLLMVATPVGWVGLLIGGIAVVAVSAGSSIAMNSLVQESGGSWYDLIMSTLK
ncbi:hypothetical protein [Microbulbifer agarilyticus]|uniref:hypothetical protein n=1 Tax=Microbulbifer agarilyticus TaxID=260552 RepID=UPI001CD30368|nr:hypothetical protein [Microbulbifer agarilyticus]MCA0901993.1 hypothetical protein [Microbulbifer agarilyticus]